MVSEGFCAYSCNRCWSWPIGPPDLSCNDTAPDTQYTCPQQALFGKCNDTWIVAGGYCASTCRRCPALVLPSGGRNASSGVSSYSITRRSDAIIQAQVSSLSRRDSLTADQGADWDRPVSNSYARSNYLFAGDELLVIGVCLISFSACVFVSSKRLRSPVSGRLHPSRS